MKYASTIGLLSSLITHQVIGMEPTELLPSLAFRAGSYAVAHPTKATIFAGLCGAAAGKIFNYPSEGFVAGVASWNTAVIVASNSETVFNRILGNALERYFREHPVADPNNPDPQALPETLHFLRQTQQEALEQLHQRKIKACIHTGIVLGGYVCKKIFID